MCNDCIYDSSDAVRALPVNPAETSAPCEHSTASADLEGSCYTSYAFTICGWSHKWHTSSRGFEVCYLQRWFVVDICCIDDVEAPVRRYCSCYADQSTDATLCSGLHEASGWRLTNLLHHPPSCRLET